MALPETRGALDCAQCGDLIRRDEFCYHIRKGYNLHGRFEVLGNGIRTTLCNDCGSDAVAFGGEQ